MMKFDVDIGNIDDIEGSLKEAFQYGQYIMDNQVLKDSNFFIPQDERYLEKSSFLHSKLGQGKIVWITPYARRLYYNPQYNFSKDKNPNAQGLWFEAAKALYKDKWTKMVEDAVRKRLGL